MQTDACRYINVITRQAKAVVLLHHMLGPTVMSFGTLITIFVINLRMCFFGSYFFINLLIVYASSLTESR